MSSASGAGGPSADTASGKGRSKRPPLGHRRSCWPKARLSSIARIAHRLTLTAPTRIEDGSLTGKLAMKVV
jgi:hypothetical protein